MYIKCVVRRFTALKHQYLYFMDFTYRKVFLEWNTVFRSLSEISSVKKRASISNIKAVNVLHRQKNNNNNLNILQN